MSNGYLTTHVLDTYNGTPGKGIKGAIFLIENENKKKIKEFKLNNDGRSESPILQKEEFIVGKYELIFYCGEYFKNFTNIKEPLFIDDVIIRFVCLSYFLFYAFSTTCLVVKPTSST